MNELTYVFVLGYGWSGSSAVVDLLKEFRGFCEPNAEFRLIKERYGIMDLEKALVEQWDGLEADIAIKDFLWLAERCNSVHRKYSFNEGLSYENLIGKHFLPKTKEYAENFVTGYFNGFWIYNMWKWNGIKRAINKILNKFHIKEYSERIALIKPISCNDFERITKKYLDSIFEPIASKNKSNHVILDQGVPAHLPDYAFKYTNKAKVIIIERDPRDVYVDLVNCKALIGAELAKYDNWQLFIDWYKSYRINQDKIRNRKDVLFLRFEDFVNNYESTLMQIFRYLNVKEDIHIHKKEYFNPTLSAKNVYIWKSYKDQNVMKMIERELKEYCYSL